MDLFHSVGLYVFGYRSVDKKMLLTIIFDICLFPYQVMVQKHNRKSSFSLYIPVLAIVDTISLLIGKFVFRLVKLDNTKALSFSRFSSSIGTHQYV